VTAREEQQVVSGVAKPKKKRKKLGKINVRVSSRLRLLGPAESVLQGGFASGLALSNPPKFLQRSTMETSTASSVCALRVERSIAPRRCPQRRR